MNESQLCNIKIINSLLLSTLLSLKEKTKVEPDVQLSLC